MSVILRIVGVITRSVLQVIMDYNLITCIADLLTSTDICTDFNIHMDREIQKARLRLFSFFQIHFRVNDLQKGMK